MSQVFDKTKNNRVKQNALRGYWFKNYKILHQARQARYP